MNGLQGEKHVTKILTSNLNNNYYLINDVNLSGGYGNIDHIVLGPTGVFVIETKNWSGDISCHGDEWLRRQSSYTRGAISNMRGNSSSPSKQVKQSAMRVKRTIESIEALKHRSIWVNGVVVFSNKNAYLKIDKPTVPVLRAKELPNFISAKEPKNPFSSTDLQLMGKEILKQAAKRY